MIFAGKDSDPDMCKFTLCACIEFGVLPYNTRGRITGSPGSTLDPSNEFTFGRLRDLPEPLGNSTVLVYKINVVQLML